MDGTTIFSVICVLLFAGYLVVRYRRYNIHRALNLPKNPPRYPDSAIKSAKEIGKFLFTRAEICGVHFMTADKIQEFPMKLSATFLVEKTRT